MIRIQGKQILAADRIEVWQLLTDMDRLSKIAPRISKVEDKGALEYVAYSKVHIGKLKGSVKANLQFADITPPDSYVLKIMHKNFLGRAFADMLIELKSIREGSHTEISFSGDLKMTGLFGKLEPHIKQETIEGLTKQMFAELGRELKKDIKERELVAV